MSSYTIHTSTSAPEGSREALEGVEAKFGFLPNLMGVMAEAPSALKGYLSLMQLVGDTSFSPIEQQVVLLAVSRTNGCAYCMAAHSAGGKKAGMPDDVLEALRGGVPIDDVALEALSSFAVSVVEKRGWVAPEAEAAFFAAGYTRTHVLEVLVCVAIKTLSNYVNHAADTPLDPQFGPFEWSAKDASQGAD